MKCLRVYSTADGESHFDEVEIPTTSRQVHPNAAAFEVSAKYAASGIRFTHIPAGARQVDWHTVPERVLTVSDGSAEYQTSDGDERRVPAGSFVLFEDVDGKGHKSLHSPEEQTVLWISLPQGLENPWCWVAKSAVQFNSPRWLFMALLGGTDHIGGALLAFRTLGALAFVFR
jgi:hypothetical protein